MIITFIYFKFDFYLFLLLRITSAFYVEKFEKNMIFKKKKQTKQTTALDLLECFFFYNVLPMIVILFSMAGYTKCIRFI